MDEIIQKLQLDVNQPIVIANDNGIITYVNALFEKSYGWTSADLVKQSLLTIIPPALHDAHNLGFSRFVTTGEATLLGKTLNLQIMTKQGDILNAAHLIQAIQEGSTWVVGANISLIDKVSQ